MQVQRFPVFAFSALLALLLAACSTGRVATPVETASPATLPTIVQQPTVAVARVPAPPDTLRWSLEGINDLSSLDPALAGDAPTFTTMSLLYAGLVRLDDQLEVGPDGASEWNVSADGTTYTFTVRENLFFADGTPVTADDFAYSINRVLLPGTGARAVAAQFSGITGAQDVVLGKAASASGVRVLNPRTLEIKLDVPQAYFLYLLVSPYTHVLPRALLESDPNWFQRAYGTGPFKVKEWRRGEALLLTANDRYWRGTPGVANVTLSFTPDSTLALQRYQAGELDIMGSQQNPLPASRLADVQSLPDFRSSAALVTRYIGFNNERAPFDNADVRRAFGLAVDKAALARDTLANAVLPADRILPPGMLGTGLPIKPLQLNAVAAKASLGTAGYPGGVRLPEVTLAYAEEGDTRLVVEALQRMWRENLSVEVKLQGYGLNEFNQSLNTTYLTPTEGLQFYISTWGADFPDPQNFLSQQLRTGIPNNNGHFSNETFDRLVDEADRLNDRTQIERRVQLYNRAEQIAIDRVGWLPLYYPKFNVLLNPRVEGIVITGNGFIAPDWSKVKLKS